MNYEKAEGEDEEEEEEEEEDEEEEADEEMSYGTERTYLNGFDVIFLSVLPAFGQRPENQEIVWEP